MKASILTSCFDCAPWLQTCINSVLNQTYTDWEWIIVEDRSRDGSLKILQKAAKKCKKIKVICNEKRLKCGGSYAKALEVATGDICCVIDSDDALARKDSLFTLISLYEKYSEIDFIWTQFDYCDPYMKFVKKGSCRVPPSSFLQAGLDYDKFRHCFSHWRTFRTYLREKGMIFNPTLPAAVDKWMGYILEELGPGGFYPKSLYLYRQRIGGLSFRGRKHWFKMMKLLDERRKSQGIKAYPKIKLKLDK